MSGTTRVSRYQKGRTNLDFTEARDGEWQWHQLGHMQVCTSLQTDNHASTPPLSFLQAGCSSCRPTNSVKAQGSNVTQNVNYVACCRQPPPPQSIAQIYTCWNSYHNCNRKHMLQLLKLTVTQINSSLALRG